MFFQTPLKVPYFKKYCPLNKEEPAEGLHIYIILLTNNIQTGNT